MAVGTLTTLSALLKRVYMDPIVEQFNMKYPLLKRVGQTGKFDVVQTDDGEKIVVSLATAKHTGIGARGDNGALPSAGTRTYTTGGYNMKYLYGRFALSGPAIRNMSSKTASFVAGLVDRNIKDMVRDLTKEKNRIAFGNGFGVLSKWSAGTDGAPYTALTTSATNYSAGHGGCFGTKYIYNGISVETVDFAAGTSMTATMASEAAGVVSGKTATQFTITTDPAYTEAAPDYWIRYGACNLTTVAAPIPLEPWGLLAICVNVDPDDTMGIYGGSAGVTTNTYTTLGELAVGSNADWTANVVYNGTTSALWEAPQDLNIDDMEEAFDAGEERGFNQPTAAYTTFAIKRKYGALIAADRRFGGTQMDLDGGFKALSLNGVPLIVDSDALPGIIFFVDESNLTFYQQTPISWMDKDGAVLSRVSGYDQYEAVAYQYYQMATILRATHTALVNINQW
jgi:hypothetical protein